MQKVEYTTEELAWAKTLIDPELPEYDEKDHEIAKLRFILHEMNERVATLHFRANKNYWRDEKDHLTVEQICQMLHDILYTKDGDAYMPDGTDQGEIDAYATTHRWEAWKECHLTDHHCGDCTAVAASCMKCHAEQFYNFRTPYEGKHAGWKALHIYLSYMDDIKAAEGEKS